MRAHLTPPAVGVLLAIMLLTACGDDAASGPGTTPAAVADPTAAETTMVAPTMDADTVLHHWQVLAAIDDGDIDDARHHAQHIGDAVASDEAHLAAMREVLAALERGEPGAAEHAITPMLTGRADPGLTPGGMHLQVAVMALDHEDFDDARHHLDHARAFGEVDAAEIDEILHLMDDGHHDQAMGHLIAMIAAHSAGEGMASLDDDDDERMPGPGVDREVPVTITEFAYEPSLIRAGAGERVLLAVENRGTVLHDLTTEDFDGEVETAGPMAEHASTMADRGAEGAFHVAVNPGDTGRLVFEARVSGEYELFCTVPGHRQLGMTARLIIE